jgi:hypothetical protein
MNGITMTSVVLALGAPIPANRAPAPEFSLVVVDVTDTHKDREPGDKNGRGRIHLVGFNKGRALPAETIWEGNEAFLDTDTVLVGGGGWQHLAAGRYLVTSTAGVFDLRKKKMLHTETGGEQVWFDETKVTYFVDEHHREKGSFTFEYATEALTRTGPSTKTEWYQSLPQPVYVSPNNNNAIEWRNDDELILHQKLLLPGSLGEGFKAGVRGAPPGLGDRRLPLLWLDDERFLTQRGNGQLVTVDLVGNVSHIATIRDVPQANLSELELFRDASGAVIYVADGHYEIDVAKKTAKKSEWMGLGNGFEVSWAGDKVQGYQLRYQGKDIGRFRCDPDTAHTAPGYLALCKDGEPRFAVFHPRGDIVVWSAATGKWSSLEFAWLGRTPIVGWIK